MIRILTCAAAFALVAAAASAQEAVATARDANAPVLSAHVGQADMDPDGENGDVAVVHIGPCTPNGEAIARQAEADGVRVMRDDKAMHGQVSAAIGTGGYRAASGTVCKPIGKNSSLTVSIGESRYGGRRRY